MSVRRERCWRHVAPMLAAVLFAPLAHAQDGDAEYRRVIDAAIGEFDAHRFADARALFVRAHELAPSARTQRGIGLTSFEMGDYLEAYRALTAALVETNRPLTEAQRAAAMALVERARAAIGVYRIVSHPNAELRVDGREEMLPPGGRILLARGSHDIVASAPGMREARTSVQVEGGEDEVLRLELSVPHAIERAPRSAPVTHPISSPDWTASYVLFAGGGAAAIGSVVTGVAWWLHQDEQAAFCQRAIDRCRNATDVARSRDGAIGTTIALALGGAGALAAAALLIVLGEPRASTAWRCTPGAASPTCGIVF